MTPFEQNIRKQFPILSRKVLGKPLVYLDNAATTQKPLSVLNAMDDFYRMHNANVHRGIHSLSEEATVAYEHAHENVAKLIHAKSMAEIIFTRGTTDSFNMLAHMIEPELKQGDEILISEVEHHSNLVPWQQLAKRKKLVLKFIPYSPKLKSLDFSHVDKLITSKTKLVSITHVSNMLGCISPIEKIAKLAHAKGALFAVDAAQSIARIQIDVQKLGVDFLAFSGHKMYGPTGIGVLYGKKDLLSRMSPAYFGGDMVREVSFLDATWNDLPWKFEAGTPPIAEGIGLSAAVDFIRKIGYSQITLHEKTLLKYAQSALSSIKGAEIYGPSPNQRAGVISFNVKKVHAHDLASLLNENGVAIRAGHHCTMPLHGLLKIPASARMSVGVYNTKEEIDTLVERVRLAQGIFS